MKLLPLFVFAVSTVVAAAQEPELCIARTPQQRVASAEFGGKTYHFTSEACRQEFSSDPERYAQLYDALEELEAVSGKVAAPAQPSLVPS